MSSMGHPNDGLRPSPVQERLRRLLFLVPYVSRHPGISLKELASELSVSKEELLSDLDLLTLVGRPPFQPDDFVDIYVENDRVYVDLDQRFKKPPRLTASEAAALAAAAKLLQPAAGDALSSALRKLQQALPSQDQVRFKQLGKQIDAEQHASKDLEPLTRAIRERKEVAFDYFSAHRGKTERRTTRPLELFAHRGHWYLSAFCKSSDERRLFRLDRVREVRVLDSTFESNAEDQRTSLGKASTVTARVKFSATAAPYVKERFGNLAHALLEGGVEVSLPLQSEAWLTQWVLSFGGEAEVLEPPSARAAILRALTPSRP